MSNKYYVTSDNINKKEKQYINRVIKSLESHGHTCKNGGVGPNQVQHFGLKKASKGMIGIQIIGGRDGWTASDFANGVKRGYYHYDSMVLCGCKEFNVGTHITAKDMDTKMSRAHDAKKGLEHMYLGKTPNEFNAKYGKYCKFILVDKFEEILEALTGDASGDASGNTNSGGGTSSSSQTYKNGIDSIKDLISVWDGEVEVKIRGDTVVVNKIDNTEPDLLIKEGVNMVTNSVTLQDYNPNTVNILNATYNGKKVSLIDEYLIERFGRHEHTIEAKKIVTRYTEGEITKDTQSQKNTQNNSEDTEAKNQTSAKRKVDFAEVPITTKSDAITFLKREWNKLRRKNGHKLELKVVGTNFFRAGEWVRVLIPNFNEDTLMYIDRVQHTASPSEEWLTSVSLIDYPPQLSAPVKQDNSDANENDTKEDDTESNTDGGDT